MVLVEVKYPFGGAKRGDRIRVPEDKVAPLRRLRWAEKIEDPPPVLPPDPASKPAARAKAKRVRLEKESGIDAVLSEET